MHPNIVIIFADDLGEGDVSCYNPRAQWQTPHMDRLAAEGMMFLDSHSTSALCTPSRYSLLTGRYNWRSRLKSMVLPGDSLALVEKDRPTLARLLQDQGYNTAVVGKWHLGLDWVLKDDGPDYTRFHVDPEDFPSSEHHLGRGGYFTGAPSPVPEGLDIDYSQRITFGPNELGFDYSFITAASLDQPPYVYIENGLAQAIPDHIAGDEYDLDRLSASMNTLIQKGPMVPGFDVHRVAPDFQAKTLEVLDRLLSQPEPFFLYVPSHLVHGPLIPNEPWEGSSGMGRYGDFVLQLDSYIGQIVDQIDDSDRSDDTIIIVTSDNGVSGIVDLPGLRSRGHDSTLGRRGHKSDIWEGGHREPFIVRWPAVIKPGSTSRQPVVHADVFATIADALGVPVPADAAEDSTSALPLWRGSDEPTRDSYVVSSAGGGLALVEGHWKLIFTTTGDGLSAHARGDTTEYRPAMLFHLGDDPTETTDLFEEHPQVVARLSVTMADLIHRGRSTPGPDRDNAPLPPSTPWTQVAWADDLP